MNYVLIYLLLVPLRTVMRLFYRPTGRSLIIQTAKIGDFINITPMLRAHAALLAALLLVTYVPTFSLTLPRLFMGYAH